MTGTGTTTKPSIHPQMTEAGATHRRWSLRHATKTKNNLSYKEQNCLQDNCDVNWLILPGTSPRAKQETDKDKKAYSPNNAVKNAHRLRMPCYFSSVPLTIFQFPVAPNSSPPGFIYCFWSSFGLALFSFNTSSVKAFIPGWWKNSLVISGCSFINFTNCLASFCFLSFSNLSLSARVGNLWPQTLIRNNIATAKIKGAVIYIHIINSA